jgi:uncharacterized MAPEG superfamily protein
MDLMWLTYTCLLTALLFLPYSLNLAQKHGLPAAFGNREKPLPLAPWAERAKRGHYNAVENLVVFAAVVLVAHLMGKHSNAVTTSAMIYFWARLVHYVAYTAGWIYVRTLAWLVGWICTLVIIVQILS